MSNSINLLNATVRNNNANRHRIKTESNSLAPEPTLLDSFLQSMTSVSSNPFPDLVSSNTSEFFPNAGLEFAPVDNVHNYTNNNTPASFDLFAELPADAFEPLPFKENNNSQTQTPIGATLLETVLDRALGVATEPDCLSSDTRKQEHPLPVITAAPAPKRRRTAKNDGEPRFRGYQEQQWMEQFNALTKYKEQNGDCLVPHTYPENQILSRWVKRQRYQYKLKMSGKVSTMTDDRIKLLEDVGFVWDSHASAWDKRFKELKQYCNLHGHCNVPSNFPENRELATWIKCQRRQYKLYWAGSKSSSMTVERMQALNELGFIWKVREDLPLPNFR